MYQVGTGASRTHPSTEAAVDSAYPSPPPTLSPTGSVIASSSTNSSLASRVLINTPQIIVYQKLGYGAVGTTFLAEIDDECVVAKFAHPGCEEVLAQEAAMYERLRGLEGISVPRFFGRFEGDGQSAIFTSFEGEKIESFEVLLDTDRSAILRALTDIHKAGIQHNDIRPSNILKSATGNPVIIDFSHAELHECVDPATCYELQGLADKFGIDVML